MLLGREREKRHSTVAFVSLHRIHFFQLVVFSFHWVKSSSSSSTSFFVLFFIFFLSWPVSCCSLWVPSIKQKHQTARKQYQHWAIFPLLYTELTHLHFDLCSDWSTHESLNGDWFTNHRIDPDKTGFTGTSSSFLAAQSHAMTAAKLQFPPEAKLSYWPSTRNSFARSDI